MSTSEKIFDKPIEQSSAEVVSERPFECILDDSSSDDESTDDQLLKLDSIPEGVTSGTSTKTKTGSSAASPQLGPSQAPSKRNNTSEDDLDEVILSMTWLKGRVGASYYNITTSELFVMDDVIEDEFTYCITRLLYRQSQPRYVLATTSSPDGFLNTLKKLIVKDSANASMPSGSALDRSSEVALKILPKLSYTFDDCLHRVNCLKLKSEPAEMLPEERPIFLNSVLNFNSRLMIQSLGMLLKYIDTNWGRLALDPNGEATYLYINYIRLNNQVMMEEETFKELKIMQTKYHPSLFKFGAVKKHEGMNLFTLLNRCQSRIGVQHLWRLMQQPTRDLRVLQERFRVTEFFLKADNNNVLESFKSTLKHIVRLTPALLNRFATPLAKPHDWKKLSSTLSNIIHIGELADSCRNAGDIFAKVADSTTPHMQQSRYFIDYTVDHEMSKHQGKFVVRSGVDSKLDELNHVKRSLPDILANYLEKDLKILPDEVDTAKLTYLPDIGFLLAVTGWIGKPPDDVEIPGVEFKCSINCVRHYKSDAARELDETIGDIVQQITHRQSEILMRLINFIAEGIGSIVKTIEHCAELDALISLSTIARDHNYVKPQMIKAHEIDIKNGRHPLRELFCEYVANDTKSGADYSLVKIFSGPNACGKSVYMKQVALIVYMAHIGCYVPASSARIGVITNILTQIPTMETSCSNASSFLTDLRKINNILYSSTPNSLIIMDEFGRGTAEIDGLSLLTAVLNNFISRKNYCPHIFVATHMHRLGTLLPLDPIIELQKFDFIFNDDNELVFLYKLISGCIDKSFAHAIAKSVGLREDVVAEAVGIFEIIKNGGIPSSKPEENGRIMMKRIAEVSKNHQIKQPLKLKNLIKAAVMRNPKK